MNSKNKLYRSGFQKLNHTDRQTQREMRLKTLPRRIRGQLKLLLSYRVLALLLLVYLNRGSKVIFLSEC